MSGDSKEVRKLARQVSGWKVPGEGAAQTKALRQERAWWSQDQWRVQQEEGFRGIMGQVRGPGRTGTQGRFRAEGDVK